MITPQDIKKQSLSWWKELLLSITTGESFFPKEISRIGKITAKDILLKLTEYKASIAELQKGRCVKTKAHLLFLYLNVFFSMRLFFH